MHDIVVFNIDHRFVLIIILGVVNYQGKVRNMIAVKSQGQTGFFLFIKVLYDNEGKK